MLPPIPASISSKTSVAAPAAGPEPAERQHHPRELAAGRGVAERRRLDPGVRGDAELDRLAARGAVLVRVRIEDDLEPRPVHRQAAPAPSATRFSSGRAAFSRPALSFSPSSARRAFGLGQRRGRLGAAFPGALQPRDLGPAALGVGEHRLDAAAVLAFEPVDRLEPFLDPEQPARVGGDALGVVAQLGGDVADLDVQRRDPLGDRVERRVEPVRRGEPRFGLGQRRRRAAAFEVGAGRAPRGRRPPPR